MNHLLIIQIFSYNLNLSIYYISVYESNYFLYI